MLTIIAVLMRAYRAIVTAYYKKRVSVTASSVGHNLYVGGPTVLSGKVHIGNHVSFNGLKVNGVGTLNIGNYFHSGTECLIITSNHNYDSGRAIPYDDTHVEKTVTIQDFVWLGDRVTVLGNVTIGEGAIIQAGAVVTQDIPPYSIAGGSPAKVFKQRDITHFVKLREEGKYH